MLRLIGILLGVLCILFFAGNGRAVTKDPKYNEIASAIAQQPLDVWCYAPDEYVDPAHIDPYSQGAWGYVWPTENIINLSQQVCNGLKQAQKGIGDVWAGLGALVLTHEAYHLALRYGESREDEGKTECRAIKNVQKSLISLSLTGNMLKAAYFWALTWDWRTIWTFPEYFYKPCKRDSSGELGFRNDADNLLRLSYETSLVQGPQASDCSEDRVRYACGSSGSYRGSP